MPGLEQLLHKARTNLLYFIKAMMPAYEIAPHHRLLCDACMRVLDTPGSRLMVSLPPRHGKSMIISEFLPAFAFGYQAQNEQIIAASYGSSLAVQFGKKVRRLIESPEYKLLFPEIETLGQSSAGGYIELADGMGEYKAVGRGGAITGFSSRLTLVDDILKDSQEAQSTAVLEGLHDWWNTTMASRTMPGGRIIIVSTRWAEQDLQGYLLEKEAEQWEYINIPALCIDPKTDLLGRAEEDEALWPSWYDKEYLTNIRQRDAYQFSALYQGNPAAKEGNLFEAAWLNYYDEVPNQLDCIVASWDTASTAKATSCYNAGLVFGLKDNKAYLLSSVHERFKFPELFASVKAQIGNNELDYLLIEDASSGTSLMQLLEGETGNCKVIPISKQGNKLLKFASILHVFKEGQVLFPREGQEAVVGELLAYPYSTYSDSVVAIAHFVTWWQTITGKFKVPLKSNRTARLLQNQQKTMSFFDKQPRHAKQKVKGLFNKSSQRSIKKFYGYYTV